MNQFRDELNESIGVPPVSTIDIDRTVSRMRRVVRLRQIATATTAVVAVIGLSVGAVAYAGISRDGKSGGAPPVIAGAPSVTATAAPETEQQKVARLTTALVALTTQAMPGAQFVANVPAAGPFEFQAFRPEGVPTTSLYDTVVASADVQDSAGVGAVSITIGRAVSVSDGEWWCNMRTSPHAMPASAGGPDGLDGDAPPGCTGEITWAGKRFEVFGTCAQVRQIDALTGDPLEPRTCQESTGPHGETVVSTTRTINHTSVDYQVDITRPDGTTMVLNAMNWGRNGVTSKISSATRPSPPLTTDQLIAIGTDPSLAFRP